MNVIKIFVVCSGLGQVKRGFESFTQECFEVLSQDSTLEITLFKGGGVATHNTIPLWNIPRHTDLAKQFGKVISREPYFVEQASFVLSLLPHIQSQKPDVIYFSDGAIGNLLWHWRRLTHQHYKLLLSNGGPCNPPYIPHCDHIQQVAPFHFQTAVTGGVPANKQSLVPYGIHVERELEILSQSERVALRDRLGLPKHRSIILSVGAINKGHKRMDYVIREVANLPEPRPYLVLLGQQESESPEIIQLGNQLLGAEHFQVKTVSSEVVADYYKAADIFVLASLGEGFGRVYLEAMSYGLPCLAHDYEVSRFVLGEVGYLANLEESGNLSGLIRQVLVKDSSEDQRRSRHLHVYEHFSWEQLCPNYVEMIRHIVSNNNHTSSLREQ